MTTPSESGRAQSDPSLHAIMSERHQLTNLAYRLLGSLADAEAALYLRCVWVFAVVGRGTPGPWDAPRRFVAIGPYRWMRNPICVAAVLVVLGAAWLFLSLPLLLYTAAMAISFHLFVVGCEERTLHRRFGDAGQWSGEWRLAEEMRARRTSDAVTSGRFRWSML
ncbi:MAG TPA: methyltransferase [Actinomycetes bacterium]|jgi:hypothetical protein|nr:methyltransferase [Actinomycetes bacterium]